ncbi:hypothetical protein ACDQ55_21615 [Chitinophaga sp. 30R24]|uniref:hypothetical protein n=1 Tax=Chitinophaga sp. 30R24 TaxID=3248838 RepID=UPI003B8EE90C
MAGISSNALLGSNYAENRKKYNGIEFTNELDLNLYDAQLRNLDPQIGRWNQIDPKTEKMEMWSPYVSNYDNPIRYNDFLGDEPGPGDGLWSKIVQLAGIAKDNFKRNTTAEINFVRDLGKQGINNFKNRIATGTTTPQLILNDFKNNPLAAITGVGGLEIKVAAVATEELALSTKVAGLNTKTAVGLEVTAKIVGEGGGVARAAQYSSGWPSSSLQGAIERFAPGAEGVVSGQKTLYTNSETGVQVVSDNSGNYFRIQDTNLSGRRSYLDLNGTVPNNKVVDGRTIGRSQAEYNQVTHFNNID